MKLIQLNAWAGRLEKPLINFMSDQQTDIVCLQEAIGYDRSNAGLFASIENIQEAAGVANAAFAPVFTFSYMRSIARFGNCILSRYPIRMSETVFTNLAHKENFSFGEDSTNIRNFIHAVLDINGQLCNVITHHGYWIDKHKNGNDETLRQTKIITDYIKTIDGPVILTGDFNLSPGSASIEQLNKHFTNLSAAYKLKTTRTMLTHKTEVCDYIFVNDQIKVNHFYAADEIVSDHKALILEFAI